jgi:hypothetical protein
LRAVVLLVLLAGCRSTCAKKEETQPANAVEDLIEKSGAPPSRCMEGPWAPADQATWREYRNGRKNEKTTLSPAELSRLSDSDFVGEIQERALDKRIFRGVAVLTRPELDAYLLYELASEVDNGGFHQFFFNSAGDCAVETTKAIENVDIGELRALYTRVMSAFPDAKPAEDRTTRWKQLSAIKTTWEDEDNAFFKLHYDALLATYLRAHVAELQL